MYLYLHDFSAVNESGMLKECFLIGKKAHTIFKVRKTMLPKNSLKHHQKKLPLRS